MRTLAVIVMLAGCGRFEFDPTGGSVDGAGGDGAGADGAGADGSGGDAAPATSCAVLASTCGPAGTGSCCESLLVSGGTYHRSFDVGSDGAYPSMANPATASAFRLDRYEITVGRFRQFVAAGQGTQANPPAAGAGAHDAIPGSGWDISWNASLVANQAALVAALKCDPLYQTWTDAPGGNDSRPMNCIAWYEAMAFCAWDGGYLPTEAEWNLAATGGSLQRAYPWSSPPSSIVIDDTLQASYYVDATKECFGDGVNGCAVTDLVVVGSKPAGDGVWGQADLSGNVIEWMLDWYASYPNPCTDCANLTPAFGRVWRGGSFYTNSPGLRSGFRSFYMPEQRGSYLGARCARAP